MDVRRTVRNFQEPDVHSSTENRNIHWKTKNPTNKIKNLSLLVPIGWSLGVKGLDILLPTSTVRGTLVDLRIFGPWDKLKGKTEVTIRLTDHTPL